MNTLKTGMLLVALTLILIYAGQAIGGQQGMTLALIFAVLMNFGAYFYSDKIALAMHRAQPVTRQQAPRMYAAVERISQRNDIPMPRLYVIPDQAPNAFATGRSPRHAAVAATAGLLELMDDEELEGVLAHELAHVRNRDTLIMTVAATLAGAITYLAFIGRFAMIFGGYGGGRGGRNGNPFVLLLMLIVAPLAAMLIQLAISRSREYQADASAARFIGHGYGLARALEKLGAYAKRLPMRTARAETAHLYIVQPFLGGGMAKLFSTHPPIAERIRRLRALTV